MGKYFDYYGDFVFGYSRSVTIDRTKFYLHTHNSYEFVCILSGSGVFKIEGSLYEVKSGDFILIKPGEFHYLELDENVPYERIVMQFSEKIVKALDPELKLLEPFNNREPGCYNHYSSGDFADNNYNFYLKNITTPTNNRRLQILTNVFCLFHEITKIFNAKTQSSTKNSLIKNILTVINENIFEDLNAKTISQKLFISEVHLCRIFKKETGTTLSDYIKKKRLLEAQKLILEGNSPTDIYTKCGFKDYSTFFRSYKKEYGYSPNKTNQLLPPPYEL